MLLTAADPTSAVAVARRAADTYVAAPYCLGCLCPRAMRDGRSACQSSLAAHDLSATACSKRWDKAEWVSCTACTTSPKIACSRKSADAARAPHPLCPAYPCRCRHAPVRNRKAGSACAAADSGNRRGAPGSARRHRPHVVRLSARLAGAAAGCDGPDIDECFTTHHVVRVVQVDRGIAVRDRQAELVA